MSEPCDPDEAPCRVYRALNAGAIGAIRATGAEEDRLRAENEELRRFVEFVNLWIYRDCSANHEERLSVIQFHPTARKAARAAKWVADDHSSNKEAGK